VHLIGRNPASNSQIAGGALLWLPQLKAQVSSTGVTDVLITQRGERLHSDVTQSSLLFRHRSINKSISPFIKH